ncbi:MAG: phage major capsid protein [Azospirillaceae bacterium]
MTERAPPAERLYRVGTIEAVRGSADNRRVSLSFSSEEPVERHFGLEVLSHDRSAVDLSWFESGGAPLLLDHDRSKQIGVIERVELTPARKARATVRFGRGALAQEILDDVVDGIRRNVSVGYQIREMKRTKEGRGGEPDTYTATNWRPDEVSIVSVPADTSVGVGRQKSPETIHMSETQTADREARSEDKRAVRILKYGELAGKPQLAHKLVMDGTPYEAAIEAIDQARESDVTVTHRSRQPRPFLSDGERREYSLTRLIAWASDPKTGPDAGYEIEISQEMARQAGRQPQGYFVPIDELSANSRLPRRGQRDLVVGTPTAGGHLVGTDHLDGSFIELLRNRSAVFTMGASPMNGLVGDIAIPKQTGASTAYWIGGDGGDSLTESNLSVGQVTMTPKTLGAHTEYSRKLVLQSAPGVEDLVRRDFARVIALEIDRAVLYGTGASNQPTGLSGISGINRPEWSVTPTWDEIVDVEAAVEADNADTGSMWWCMPATTKALLKKTQKVSGEPAFLMDDSGRVNGYPHALSNQISDYEAFFGVWSNLIVGMWGGFDLIVDPYSQAKSAKILVTAMQSIDVAVRYPESFVYLTRASNSGENV